MSQEILPGLSRSPPEIRFMISKTNIYFLGGFAFVYRQLGFKASGGIRFGEVAVGEKTPTYVYLINATNGHYSFK